jgi:hypothetical protein
MCRMQDAAAAWQAILEASAENRIGQNRPYAARIREHLRSAAPEGLIPAAERGAALLDAGLVSRAATLALAAYTAVSLRCGAPVPQRIRSHLLRHAWSLESWELLDLAGESLRACDPADVDRHFFVAPIDVRMLGHVGGAERAARLVAEIRTWPKGAFSALKKKAQASGVDRYHFARRLGYSAPEFAAYVVEGLTAFGVDAVGPLVDAVEAGTASDAMLLDALGRIGGDRATATVARARASKKAPRRTAAIPAPDAEAARAFDDSNGEAWASMRVSGATLDGVLGWWVRHLGGGSWYSPRPAFAQALKAHAHLEGAELAATSVLERIDRGVDTTITALLEAFGERVHAPLADVARAGRAKDAEEVLRVLDLEGLLPGDAAVEAGASERSAVRERALAIVLGQGEAARGPVLAAVGHRSPNVRALSARVIEVRGWSDAEPLVRAAEARETHAQVRLVQRRAVAVLELASAPVVSCAQMDAALARFAGEPRPDFIVGGGNDVPLAWCDGTDLSPAAVDGFLVCAGVEDEIAPSPLAHRAARLFAPASGEAWAAAVFLEKPNMSRRADAFRAYASVMCMSEERLEAFLKRTRRRTAGPLYRHVHAMLVRRATPVAVKYLGDFSPSERPGARSSP